jgi:hypothetical protein
VLLTSSVTVLHRQSPAIFPSGQFVSLHQIEHALNLVRPAMNMARCARWKCWFALHFARMLNHHERAQRFTVSVYERHGARARMPDAHARRPANAGHAGHRAAISGLRIWRGCGRATGLRSFARAAGNCRQKQCRFKRPGQFWTVNGLRNLYALEEARRNQHWDELWIQH